MLLGKSTGWELVEAYAFQGGWALTLLLVGRLVQSVATRRVVVQGG